MADNTAAAYPPDDYGPGFLDPQAMNPGGAGQIPTAAQQERPPTNYLDFLDKPEYKALEQANIQERAAAKADTRSGLQAMQGDLRDIENTPEPKMQRAPQAPPQQLGKGLMEFMQIATVLGALAGGKARTGATAALTAFGAGVKGFAEGNKQEFEANLETWRAQSKQVEDDNRARLEEYNAILRKKTLSMDQKLSMIKIAAAEHQDEITFNLAEMRRPMEIAGLMQKSEEMHQHYVDTRQRMDQSAEAFQLRLKQEQDKFDQAEDIVGEMQAGRQPPTLSGLGLGEARYVRQAASKVKFDMSKAQMQWAAAHKQVLSQNGPQQLRYFGLAADVERNIDRVDELAGQLQNSGVVPLNRVKLEALINLEGNTPRGQLATRYIAAVNDLKEPLANLANGGYAPTEPAWQLANQQVNGNYGVLQLKSSLDEVKRSIGFRNNAIRQQGGLPPGSENPYSTAPPVKSGGGQAAPTAPQGNDGWSIVK